MNLRVRRVYEPAEADDGKHVLVDRLWPRGIQKQRAGIDHWLKDLAPSHELRRQFHGQAQVCLTRRKPQQRVGVEVLA